MGKSRGRGGGRGGGGAKRPPHVCEEEEEYIRSLEGQDPRAGRMPSDSEESDEGERIGPVDHQPVISRQRGSGQSATVGMLPPSDSESSDEEEVAPPPPQQEAPRRRKDDMDEPDPEQVRKDIERLQLIKEKREKERQARIEREGWDRFAPVSETNKPPAGGAPRTADA
uniref:Casein kinase substrate phosphoprotein PP28 domain-containing protein n=1 Tax=Tetraselmis chuii TaxID=63592 RepID=A0A7S1X5D5_9CHLO|mmetsp:Transcript_32663/g.58473  ORF Transcript_32663/g.58473 Transcript_32663/m.58473 type:complete len:169 (+) Transcript_32663:114-620(+)